MNSAKVNLPLYKNALYCFFPALLIGLFTFFRCYSGLSDQVLLESGDIENNIECIVGELTCFKPAYIVFAPLISPFLLADELLQGLRIYASIAAALIVGSFYWICFFYLKYSLIFRKCFFVEILIALLSVICSLAIYRSIVGFSPLASRLEPAPFYHLFFQTLSIAVLSVCLVLSAFASRLSHRLVLLLLLFAVLLHSSSVFAAIVILSFSLHRKALFARRGKIKSWLFRFCSFMLVPRTNSRLVLFALLSIVLLLLSFLVPLLIDSLLGAYNLIIGGNQELGVDGQSYVEITRAFEVDPVLVAKAFFILILLLVVAISPKFFGLSPVNDSRSFPLAILILSCVVMAIISSGALFEGHGQLYFRLNLITSYFFDAIFLSLLFRSLLVFTLAKPRSFSHSV